MRYNLFFNINNYAIYLSLLRIGILYGLSLLGSCILYIKHICNWIYNIFLNDKSTNILWLISAIMNNFLDFFISSFQKIENPCFIYIFRYNLENLSNLITIFKFSCIELINILLMILSVRQICISLIMQS